MKRYDRYSKYEDRWITSLPSHWGYKRLKEVLKERKEKNSPVKTHNILSLTNTRGVIPYSEKGNVGNKAKESLEGYMLAYPNDIVINSMNIIIGSVGLSKYFGAVSPVYYMLYTRNNDNIRYFNYVFQNKPFQESLRGLGNGILEIRMRIPMYKLNNVCIPVPPRSEQDQIVRYLDWQVSKINKLIAAKKKQIAELREVEQSLIYHYVTRGVKENIKFKHSGINWVDEIPDDWRILFLSQVSEEQCIKNKGMLENNLLSLSYGRIIPKDINTTEGLLPTSFEGYQIVYPGNIILRLTDLQNDHKSLRTGLVKEKGIITSAYTCLKVHDNILPEFLRLQLHAADLCKVFYGMGGGVRQSIGYNDIRRMLIFVPSIKEQEQIISVINKKCDPIQKCCESINSEIATLQELKTRLISDVVTGQIDVRDIVIPEYEYVEEEPNDEPDDTLIGDN